MMCTVLSLLVFGSSPLKQLALGILTGMMITGTHCLGLRLPALLGLKTPQIWRPKAGICDRPGATAWTYAPPLLLCLGLSTPAVLHRMPRPHARQTWVLSPLSCLHPGPRWVLAAMTGTCTYVSGLESCHTVHALLLLLQAAVWRVMNWRRN